MRVLAPAAVVAALSLSAPVMAQNSTLPTYCAPSPAMHALALARLGAQPAGRGLAGEDGMALGELLIAPDGRWAFYILLPDGTSCAVASGSDWQELTITPEQEGEPS